MGSIRWGSHRLVSLAFATVALAFVASTLFTIRHMTAIDEAALAISENAAPSIEYLAGARGELRRLAVLVSDSLEQRQTGYPGLAEEVAASQQKIDKLIQTYVDLPVFPGERQIWEDVRKSLTHVDDVVAQILDRTQEQDFASAQALVHNDLRRAVGEASDGMMRCIEFDAQHSRDLARTIRHLRGRSAQMALGLDALSIALAVAAAVLASRWVRAHTRLLETHSRLLQERADELEQFSGRVAHDILSPLSTVSFSLELSGRALDESKRLVMIERGLASLERVQRIVRGLLDFARAGAPPEHGAVADVREIIDDVATELIPAAEEAHVELRFEPVLQCTVACSPGILTSLISNLVRNAIKYIGEGAVKTIDVRVLDRNPLVRIEVEDTGPGLPPGMDRIVFEPYVRGRATGRPGIGLGLATVKRMAEAHGGSAAVKSEVGQGCLFWFELPKGSPSELRAPKEPASVTPLARGA